MVDATLTRRHVLKGLGGLALSGCAPLALGEAGSPIAGAEERAAGPNRPVALSGRDVIAERRLRAGEDLHLRVGSPSPYAVEIKRVGWDTEGGASTPRDWLLQGPVSKPAAPRVVRPGSYVHIERAFGADDEFEEATLECWVRRWAFDVRQGLISQLDDGMACGFALFLDAASRPVAYFGDGGGWDAELALTAPDAVPRESWVHLVARLRGDERSLWVDGVEVAKESVPVDPSRAGVAPLRLGALGNVHGETTDFLGGDLAMPVIYARALEDEEIRERAAQELPTIPEDPGAPGQLEPSLVGCWPLEEEGGASVADVSPAERHGEIVNRGTWMIGGPGHDALAVLREDVRQEAPSDRGHALRLSPQDLYEVDWPVNHTANVPATLPSGLYVARLGWAEATVVVEPAASQTRARVVVIAPTNTWIAYSTQRLSGTVAANYGPYGSHQGSELPGYQIGMDLPWPAATPRRELFEDIDYAANAKTLLFLQIWLEQHEIDFDVIADETLHEDPEVLRAYGLVIIPGHSEYWTAEAYHGLRAYLDAGGSVLHASGNSIFWRVTIEDGVMECRKMPIPGNPVRRWGEVYHAHDKARGGLMRDCGLPCWELLGVESAGCRKPVSEKPQQRWTVKASAHDFFRKPENVGVANGDEIGDHAVRNEYDATLDAIDLAPSYPATRPTVLADARTVNDLGRPGTERWSYDGEMTFETPGRIAGEMVDWQRFPAGRVFAAPTIASTHALYADRRYAKLFRNAMHHLGLEFRMRAFAVNGAGELQSQQFRENDWDGPSAWRTVPSAQLAGPPAAARWQPNRLVVGCADAYGQLQVVHQTGDGTVLGTWSLGGGCVDRPAFAAVARDRLHLFSRSTGDELLWFERDTAAWLPPVMIGEAGSAPSAATVLGDRVVVATRAAGGDILVKTHRNGAWTPGGDGMVALGVGESRPTVVSWNGNRVSVLWVDGAGDAFVRHQDGEGSWSPALRIAAGLRPSAPIAAAPLYGEELQLAAIADSGSMRVGVLRAESSIVAWTDLGETFVGEPALATFRGESACVMATRATNAMLYAVQDGTGWGPWRSLSAGRRPSPALVAWAGDNVFP